MLWERWRIPIMLAPTLIVILILFVGGLAYGVLQSLGWQPRIGSTALSLDAYVNILTSERYAPQFWSGLWLTLWVSLVSTALSAVLAVFAALMIRSTGVGKRLATFLFQLNLPIPHVVAAIGIVFVFSQSGLLSRLGAAAGLFGSPADFPVLVRDGFGIGIILAYVWKELPFVGVIVLAVLTSLGEDYEQVAASLGANAWQRFRHVVLPLIMPGLLSASVIVFAFTFGSYEVPAILGVRANRLLPVLALDFFRNPDLNARAEGMALSVIIAGVALLMVAASMWLARRTVRK